MRKMLAAMALMLVMSVSAMAQNIEPKFPGGESAMMQFIAKNLRYPAICMENGVEGIVKVEVVIMPDSTIGSRRIVTPIDPDLEAEALRVVKLMPKWAPATVNGTPVKYKRVIPFRFRLK